MLFVTRRAERDEIALAAYAVGVLGSTISRSRGVSGGSLRRCATQEAAPSSIAASISAVKVQAISTSNFCSRQ